MGGFTLMLGLTSPCCQPAGFVDGAVLTSHVANHHKSGPAASFDTEWEVSVAVPSRVFSVLWTLAAGIVSEAGKMLYLKWPP